MNLKYFIYSICLAGMALTSCQKEDELGNIIDTSSPYVLDYLADSTDEIDQRRYQIFKTYGVPAFLNDVISEEVVGIDYKGDPIYKRETLDISWDFNSDPNTSYDFTYLITEDADEVTKVEEIANTHLALDYVETYLSMAGKTKPFSILLLKNLVLDGSTREYYKSFRTLYIGNACNYPDEADMRMKSGEIINASVFPLVNQDEELLAEFETFSDEKHYYNKQWQRDFGETFSAELNALTSVNLGLKLSNAFDESFVNSLVNHQFLYYVAYYNMSMPGITKDAALNLYGNASNVQAAVKELVSMAAKYGFIGGGWSTELIYTPTLSKDVEAYVKIILQLGAGGFEERYGEYPLVMQKFNVLRDYIENELGVSLDYNNIN